MRNKRVHHIIICILIFFHFSFVNGEDPDTGIKLQNLFDRIMRSNNDTERIILNDSVRIIVERYANSDSVMTHRFAGLRNLGQIDSPDGRIKILTWNLILREGSNTYFLYLIRKGEKKERNLIYYLKAGQKTLQVDTMSVYNADNWYGALYYAIQPFRKNRSDYYILLGLNFATESATRKIIDVLSFDDQDEILFGLDCFIMNGKVKKREVIEYSPEGVVSLRLNSEKMIVFDRISSYAYGHAGPSENLGPDGIVYDGYIFKKGEWQFKPNIDIRNKK